MKSKLILNIFGMSGMGLFAFAVIRARLFGHKSSVLFIQQAWDAIAGTSGTLFNVLTILAGASVFASLWLFFLASLLLRNKKPTFQCSVSHTTGIFGPAALLIAPALLALLGGPSVLLLSCGMSGLLVLWVLVRMVFRAGDIQPCSTQPNGIIRNLCQYLLVILLVAMPIIVTLAAIYFALHKEKTDNGILPYTAYILSFDTEEDWCPQDDAVRNKELPSRSFKLNSYKYITFGLLEKLALGLSDRKIPATFYCIPNLAKDHPEILRRFEKLGHEIAVHLHMHNVQDVGFPYYPDDKDMLSSYSPSIQASAILKAKRDIEKVLGHPVYSFRSGGWSCDPGVENACVSAGFQSISNHESTYLLPSGMWQIATAKSFDILREPRMFWRSLKWDNNQKLIPLFSHPMILFDHAANRSREAIIQKFFKELDDFRHKYPNVHFMTTTAAASLLKYKPPSIRIRMAAGTISILLILGCLFVSLQGLKI